MEPRFRVRLDQLRDDAQIPPGLTRGLLSRIEAFLQPFADSLRCAPQRTNAQHYVQGLLSDLPSKDAESIAYFHDRERQGLQKFLGQADWDYRPLFTELTRQVGSELGQADGVLVFDPSAFPKKGTESVGVARQWCGRLGKIDNCQVGIYLAYVARSDHALVDVRLYLPKEWTRDRKRRTKAGVPKDVRFHTRHELALEMLDQRGPLLPHAWLSGDDEMGRCSWFRQELRQRGESYLLAVPSNTLVRDLLTPEPPYSGHGRRPQVPFQRAQRWAASVPESAWQTLEVRDGERGPLLVQGVWRIVEARTQGRASNVAEALVVFRERQSDGTWRHDYLLSDVIRAKTLVEFARVFKAQHRVEECFERAKGEAGLGDYQVRTWTGWHHHQALALVATWFLSKESRRGKNTDTGADATATTSAAGWSAEAVAGERTTRAETTHRESAFTPQRRSAVLSLEATQPLTASSL
jgi:SRSO17 transposase